MGPINNNHPILILHRFACLLQQSLTVFYCVPRRARQTLRKELTLCAFPALVLTAGRSNTKFDPTIVPLIK